MDLSPMKPSLDGISYSGPTEWMYRSSVIDLLGELCLQQIILIAILEVSCWLS